MKAVLLIIVCCFFTVSCDNIQNKEESFPIEETLAQELFPLKGLTSPGIVEVKSPFLIVENMKQNDSIFHIYDLRNCELDTAFGERGGGPNEFSAPWIIHSQLRNLIIVDKNTFLRYKINQDGRIIIEEKLTPACANDIYDAAFVNDTLFVVDAQYVSSNLYLFNIKDDSPQKSLQYRNPNITDLVRDPNYGRVYANGNRIILAYEYKKEIDFMDTEFNLIKKVKFDFQTSDESLLGKGDENSAYTYGYLGNHYFYVIYLGTTWKKYRKQNTYNTYLEVFNLDGNPVARYLLKGKSPVNFAVDETTFTLYGTIDDGIPEDNLLVYKLKGLSY